VLQRLPLAFIGVRNLPCIPVRPSVSSAFHCCVDSEPMEPNARRQKRRETLLSSLDVAIETLNIAKEIASITPAKAVFGSVSVILAMIKVGGFRVDQVQIHEKRTGFDE